MYYTSYKGINYELPYSVPNMDIITQVDQLSEYMKESPELDSVQEHCKDLINSISEIRSTKRSILGLWRGISSGNKIGAESIFGNVFKINILGKIDILVKTSQFTEEYTPMEDALNQTHEASRYS